MDEKCYRTIKSIDKAEEWQKLRKSGIGGSDAGVILGFNKWKSKYELYMEKISDEVKQHVTSEAIEKGNRCEAPITDLFYAIHPEYKRLETKDKTFISTRYPWMHANLDGMYEDQEGNTVILEIKTANAINKDMAAKWGYWDAEAGEYIEQIPDTYYAQLIHYMLVTNATYATLVALLEKRDGMHELREYTVFSKSDDEMELINKEKEFWKQVANREPPEMIEI